MTYGEWQNAVVALTGTEDSLDYQMKNPWPAHAVFRPFFNDFDAFFYGISPQEWIEKSLPENRLKVIR